MNRNLSHLCLEHKALDTHEITNVKQFLEKYIVGVFVLTRA